MTINFKKTIIATNDENLNLIYIYVSKTKQSMKREENSIERLLCHIYFPVKQLMMHNFFTNKEMTRNEGDLA